MTMLNEMADSEKPREKFLHRGADALTDAELLAILIRTGIKGRSVLEVAGTLLVSLPNQNLGHLGETDVKALCTIPGIGRDKAVTLCAAVELGKRIAKKRIRIDNPDFSSPHVVAEYVMEDMRFLAQECFVAVYLSTKNRLICVKTLTVGTINASFAKARDVFRYALQYNAAAVVLLHNHPSGDPEPSHEDITVTQQLAETGALMEIPVLDHIIIGDGIYVSLCERGYL